ncbi:MAG: sulfatase-like hydrolase/transferase, partial [Verrucomicrobiia bacterium]
MRLLLLSLSLAGFTFAARDTDRPNVVILFTDDQGTLDVNSYGSTDLQTPNLDQLARTGIRFTQ